MAATSSTKKMRVRNIAYCGVKIKKKNKVQVSINKTHRSYKGGDGWNSEQPVQHFFFVAKNKESSIKYAC